MGATRSFGPHRYWLRRQPSRRNFITTAEGAQSQPTCDILRPNHHNKRPHSERSRLLARRRDRGCDCPGRPARLKNVPGPEGEKKKVSDEPSGTVLKPPARRWRCTRKENWPSRRPSVKNTSHCSPTANVTRGEYGQHCCTFRTRCSAPYWSLSP